MKVYTKVYTDVPNVRARQIPLLTEEGWLRHQENVGEAYLSAADGVVAHTAILVCERPPRPLQ